MGKGYYDGDTSAQITEQMRLDEMRRMAKYNRAEAERLEAAVRELELKDRTDYIDGSELITVSP